MTTRFAPGAGRTPPRRPQPAISLWSLGMSMLLAGLAGKGDGAFFAVMHLTGLALAAIFLVRVLLDSLRLRREPDGDRDVR